MTTEINTDETDTDQPTCVQCNDWASSGCGTDSEPLCYTCAKDDFLDDQAEQYREDHFLRPSEYPARYGL